MHEIQLKNTHAMKLDILVAKHKLSKRQKQILQQLLETNEDFTIQQYESFYPDVNRRTLQRDLSDLEKADLPTGREKSYPLSNKFRLTFFCDIFCFFCRIHLLRF